MKVTSQRDKVHSHCIEYQMKVTRITRKYENIMNIKNYTRLGSLFSNCSTDIWNGQCVQPLRGKKKITIECEENLVKFIVSTSIVISPSTPKWKIILFFLILVCKTLDNSVSSKKISLDFIFFVLNVSVYRYVSHQMWRWVCQHFSFWTTNIRNKKKKKPNYFFLRILDMFLIVD